jgi:hypothetical protein
MGPDTDLPAASVTRIGIEVNGPLAHQLVLVLLAPRTLRSIARRVQDARQSYAGVSGSLKIGFQANQPRRSDSSPESG